MSVYLWDDKCDPVASWGGRISLSGPGSVKAFEASVKRMRSVAGVDRCRRSCPFVFLPIFYNSMFFSCTRVCMRVYMCVYVCVCVCCVFITTYIAYNRTIQPCRASKSKLFFCVCVYVYFIQLRITAQSGPAFLVILWYSYRSSIEVLRC